MTPLLKRNGPSANKRTTLGAGFLVGELAATDGRYLFASMIHCATGHQPLSMQGKARKGHHYYACSYGANYGDRAATEVHAGQKWIYLREDALLPLVERFFAQRIFGPLRLQKLAQQLKAHNRDERRANRLAATRLRQHLADTDRKLRIQIQAYEDGIDAELITARITELRTDRDTTQAALDAITPEERHTEDDYLTERLARLPDPAAQLHDAPRELKRQTFDAFELRIRYDKAARHIHISATVTEVVANAFENTKALQTEGFQVTVTDIAGARFVRRGDARVVEAYGLAA